MTLVIINGDIDLSVGSMVALCAAALATMYEAGVPLSLAALAAFMLGPLLGFFNGFVVTRFGLPSLVVTLGTLALFRGAAQVIMGDRSVSGYPDGFVGIDRIGVFGTRYDIPVTLVLFGVLAVGIGLLLHRSSFGRCCFMIGSNPDAARYSGIDVDRVRVAAFVLSGTMAGLAAVLFTSRLGSTRSDLATGTELLVITIVVLGGTDIFGGRGSIAATTVAWCAVIALGQAMALDNVNGQTQDAVLGAVLIGSILLPHVFGAVNRRLRSARRRRPTPAAASAAQPEGSK
jgi:rhamnose transport system permease protein